MLSLLCPYSASQPTQPSANEAGSEGEPDSVQMYVVAPTQQDCPNDTYMYCETLSYYARKYTNELSNVVFWILPGMHNLSGFWNLKNSRNITLLGGKDLINRDKSSTGMTKIECQGNPGGIHVSNSNFTVVENIAIAYCYSALAFDITVNAIVRNVIITDGFFLGLLVLSSQPFTLTKSTIENCEHGIYLEGTSSVEISNSQISSCPLAGIFCTLKGGSVTLNQTVLNGNGNGFYCSEYDMEFDEKATINIFNSRIIVNESDHSAISLYLDNYQGTSINIDSVLVTGNGGGIFGISILDSSPEVGSEKNYATARIHNVTIENFGGELDADNTANPAAIYLVWLRNLTISDCTIKNNRVTGIVLFASTAFLQGNITLTNNSGLNGGGMALYSNSFIVLDYSTRLRISNNFAAMFGGGIYVSPDIILYDTPSFRRAVYFCFVSSVSKGVQPLLEVTRNSAKNSGQDLYGAYLEKCIPPLFNGKTTLKVSEFINVHSMCNQTIISSDPVRLVLCNDSCVNTNEEDMTHVIPQHFPGQEFNFTVAAIGEQFGLTPAIIST